MAKARELADLDLTSMRDLRKLASGPGKLCEALGITRPRDNEKDMLSPESDLQVMSDGFRVDEVAVTQRIGITKVGGVATAVCDCGECFFFQKSKPPAIMPEMAIAAQRPCLFP